MSTKLTYTGAEVQELLDKVKSGGSGGGGDISYDRLDSWADYSADKSGWVLSAALGFDINTRLTSVENAGYVTASYLAPYVLRSELDGYLSKSGGTLSGKLTVSDSGPSIVCKRTQDLAVLIGFENVKGKLGSLGINTNKSILFIDATDNYRTVLDSGNYTTYAFSKSGGTIEGKVLVSEAVNSANWISDSGQIRANCKGTSYYIGLGATAGGVAVIQGGHSGAGAIPLLLNPSSGNVAIGGQTADAKLHVYGNTLISGGNNPHLVIKDNINRQWYLQYYDNHISIGTSYSNGVKIDSAGNLLTIGSLSASAVATNSLTIGSATLTYDSANNALCINGNMYALGGVTAGGAGISAYTSLEARVARLEQQLNIS